jgi:predicted nucleotide-binding protein (sugar kinase/HSP70/actin superfamily)
MYNDRIIIHKKRNRTYNALGDEMDKIKIGIPRALHYYYYGDMWRSFLEELGYEVVISPKTTREILENGCKCANDEMCLSLKLYLGHIHYLVGKCDAILVPRIDNYGTYNQTCTNFLGLYDIVANLFKIPLFTYNVDETHKETEMKAFIKLGMLLGKGKEQSKIAYFNSVQKVEKEKKKKRKLELEKLSSSKKKLLVMSHPYNFEDALIGTEIKNTIKNLGAISINANALIENNKNDYFAFSSNLYWKYNKDLVGILPFVKDRVDGILFLSTFPCGPDSLVNELLMRKIKMPYLNLIIDEESGSAGMETRLESFIDILEQKKVR